MRGLMLVACSFALLLGGVTVASAGKGGSDLPKKDVDVVLEQDGNQLKVRVTSKREACFAAKRGETIPRVVIVTDDGELALLINRRGKAVAPTKIVGSGPALAVYPRQVIFRRGEKRFICRRAESETIQVARP